MQAAEVMTAEEDDGRVGIEAKLLRRWKSDPSAGVIRSWSIPTADKLERQRLLLLKDARLIRDRVLLVDKRRRRIVEVIATNVTEEFAGGVAKRLGGKLLVLGTRDSSSADYIASERPRLRFGAGAWSAPAGWSVEAWLAHLEELRERAGRCEPLAGPVELTPERMGVGVRLLLLAAARGDDTEGEDDECE